jgi:hypothetical protein
VRPLQPAVTRKRIVFRLPRRPEVQGSREALQGVSGRRRGDEDGDRDSALGLPGNRPCAARPRRRPARSTAGVALARERKPGSDLAIAKLPSSTRTGPPDVACTPPTSARHRPQCTARREPARPLISTAAGTADLAFLRAAQAIEREIGKRTARRPLPYRPGIGLRSIADLDLAVFPTSPKIGEAWTDRAAR